MNGGLLSLNNLLLGSLQWAYALVSQILPDHSSYDHSCCVSKSNCYIGTPFTN